MYIVQHKHKYHVSRRSLWLYLSKYIGNAYGIQAPTKELYENFNSYSVVEHITGVNEWLLQGTNNPIKGMTMNVVKENELGCAVCYHVGYNSKLDQYYCHHHPAPEDPDKILMVDSCDKCQWWKPDE